MTSRLLIIIVLFFISACSKTDKDRISIAEKGVGDIVVGAVFPKNSVYHFLEGFELAIEDLNRKGGVLGRKVRAIVKDDEYLVQKGKEIARGFAKNPEVVAVVGHNDSDVAVPVSLIYEMNKIVFINPCATTPSLTAHGFRYVFRTVPTDTAYAEKLAKVAKKKFKAVLIVSTDDLYGNTLSDNFSTFAANLGVEIVGNIHFPPFEKDIKSEFIRCANLIEGKRFADKYDSIFLAAKEQTAAKIIKIARDLKIASPFFGADELDAPCLREVAGDAAVEGTIFCTIAFQGTDGLTAPQTSFAERFNRKYCILPNAWTAQAYDTMMVLAYAMEVAGSTLPNKVAETLHFIQDWQGITGVYTFDEKGDILDKNSDILVVRNGEGVFDAELTRLIQETE